jgi:adenosine deaminase
MNDIETFIRGIPKAELHIHIEGSLEPEMMVALAERNGVQLRFSTVDEVRAAYRFSDLQSFLDIYYEGAGVLIEEEDFHDLTWAYLQRAHRDGVKHAEIFFDPQTHTARGVAMATVVNGIHRALVRAESELSLSSRLILCFLRHLEEKDAFETLEQAKPHLELITAVGLDSSERGNPPSKFESVFAAARDLGLRTVAHAGEEGPPSYITEALDLLQAQRIDHGVRCTEDPEVVTRLARERVPLTVCPLSNVALRVFDTMENHNLRQLIDSDLVVTINSDDPPYFGGYVFDNFLAIHHALGLGRAMIAALARNSFRASFLDDDDKKRWVAEVDAFEGAG